MKHFFTFTIAILLAFVSSNAQIAIHDYSGLDLTNSTATLPVDEDYYFQITNTGDAEITFVVEVTAFSIPADATGISVCACGACTPISSVPTTIGAETILAAGDTYGEEGGPVEEFADVRYDSNGSTGDASITIKVYEQENASNYAEFTLSKATVISNLNVNKFKLYPNPVKDVFTVELNKNLTHPQIVLTNILGKLVFKQNLNSNKNIIDISHLKKGIYLYSIINKNSVIETKKLIIN